MKQQLEVIEKSRVRDVLTEEEVYNVDNGGLVLITAEGKKLKVDDEVKGTVISLTPLKGG